MADWLPGRSIIWLWDNRLDFVLPFEQFHVRFPNMAGAKSSIINCSELVFILLEHYFKYFASFERDCAVI